MKKRNNIEEAGARKVTYEFAFIDELWPMSGWIIVRDHPGPQYELGYAGSVRRVVIVRLPKGVDFVSSEGFSLLPNDLRVGDVVLIDDAGRDVFLRIDDLHAFVTVDRIRGVVRRSP